MIRGAALAFCLLSGAAIALAEKPAPSVPSAGDFNQQPVFYQRFPEPVQADDLALLRSGRVRVQHYPPVNVSSFRWERDAKTDYTWWMQMQDLRFLLPAIESDAAQDRVLVHDWVMRWFQVHMTPEPATERWGEPMSVAYRAMVLVRIFARESGRRDQDHDFTGILAYTLLEHQAFLERSENFDAASNHGIIDALGLLETTRVCAQPRLRSLACGRLEGLVGRCVSAPGLAREHSPYYHYVMMRWTSQTAQYVRTLPGVPPSLVTVLDATLRRMRDGAYFLQDHAGGIPQIGDSDSCRVQDRDPDFRVTQAPRGATRCYDADAGYAVFKGDATRGDRRYVVFRIPTRRTDLVYHLHADATGVIADYDGETLLGDGGRYSYSASEERSYFVSTRAHNVVMPSLHLTSPPGGIRLADATFDRSRADAAAWSARIRHGNLEVSRLVTVPANGNSMDVVDTLRVVGRSQRAPVEAVVLWNLGEDVRDVKETRGGRGGQWSWKLRTVSGREAVLRMRKIAGDRSAGPDVRIARGERKPRLGWYSPGHGLLRPTRVIVATVRVQSDVVIQTTLEFPRDKR